MKKKVTITKKKAKIGSRPFERLVGLHDTVWFLKSMRMCEVVEVLPDGYILETLDARKKLFATKNGVEHVD